MINILDMADDLTPESTVKGSPVLYGSGGFLKKDPKDFTRNEKLAYIEHRYKTCGLQGDHDKFIMEIRCSRLSNKAFQAARSYGLWIFNRTK